ncbi:MAG: helix-turn-helix domain-containing protein [Gammaproteobacteria bacterium]|nr:MAG: helix-turn-helix domain-containing protein [Gammaproteobacteria bacterium]
MMKQHANATTTLEMREFIRESDLPTAVLARLLKVSESTVRKWRKRDSVDDKSHLPKQLNTTLSPAQEYVVVELRTRLLLSLDELLEICNQFINPNASRAGLQRCLKRHGVSRLADMQDSGATSDADKSVQVAIEDTSEHKVLFSDVSPEAMREVLNSTKDLSKNEVVQVKVTKLPEFADEPRQRRLLVANDPDSGWVYVDIYDGDEKEAAGRYMHHVLTKAPFHIRRILAGNYNEFLSRFRLLDEPDNSIKS